MMKIEFSSERAMVVRGLAILMIVDACLALYSMKPSMRFLQNELAAQKAQLKLLNADVKRALTIQQSMPQTRADCERFENSLPSSSTGYSTITAELSETAKHSGLEIASLGFRTKDLPGRNLVEIELDATVSGDYKGVVRFLNGLQRSKNHYIIDSLALASAPTGQDAAGALRVALHMRSYFRDAA
jgi:type IV pilus assembly protein PilO